MLRPQDGRTRERRSLAGLWDFTPDAAGAGRAGEWWRGPLPDAREIPVPASYNDIFPGSGLHGHVGDVWYQTTVRTPARWTGARTVLRFDAATHRAVVWVGDERVAEHEGGYTPFEADVTAHLSPGGQDRVTVVVGNELTWETIPPGRVEELPDGRRSQRYFHDFFNYAGLHRPVWLYTTPATYVADLTVVTGFDGGTGLVDYEVDVAGEEMPYEVRATLRDAAGTAVAGAEGPRGRLRIEDVHPWAPGDGYLYRLEVALAGGAGELVDEYVQPVGVRTVEVRGTQFLINGRPFYFTGFGRHEDAAVRGKGHDDVLMVHDFALMDWIGANSFRTSHYPYAEDVLEYADRHGVVVIDETAAVGLNLALGPDNLAATESLRTFSEETIGYAAQACHLQAVRELIARDKNHPSVVMWSLTNEPDTAQPEARAYFEPIVAEARRLDATRPVTHANFMPVTPDRCVVTDLFDVVLLNRYYGWYVQMGDLASAEAALEAELRQWAEKYGKPIVISEYGADAYQGLHSVEATPWSEEYQTEFLRTYHRVFDRVEAVIGEHVWNFADFATEAGVQRVGGNKKGVFTRDRHPKAAAHLLRARWHSRHGTATESQEE